ncbi:hypothetical protein GOODEAATRI_003200 [Goodea atripinnis]|uniref:Uncharacterized protein n=1 Tax=Goodea atripinnis TaxID=208336 RepID=A0ABV0MNY6_9TELE
MWSLEGSLAEDYCRLEADWLARRHTENPLDDAGGGNLTIVTIYVNTPAGTLQKFDAVYHGALRFNTINNWLSTNAVCHLIRATTASNYGLLTFIVHLVRSRIDLNREGVNMWQRQNKK